ncbi:BTAD domain-containing putative transcriptional regulator [Micromonospora sp. NPDC049559]|uniref:AfsR/SARP family transcriptional regulator n=1 Tax=Micromonospora sp. NPDC049559 TaxID=3155923 RepID=UPI00341F2CA8
MRFEVLGPLRVLTRAGTEVPIRSRHERTLLAILLLRLNEPVTVDQLVAALWPERAPASHISNLHTYLSRLRARLQSEIEQVNGVYRLRVPDDDVDVAVFRREIAAARAALARGDADEAVRGFRRGLARWRGEPLAGLAAEPLAAQVAQLEVERLAAIEECVDAELALGGADLPSEVLTRLHGLVAEHPLRERLHGQLMVALCLTGRRADALAAYQRARDILVAELGVEPGPPLRRLHQAILRGEEITPPVPVRPPEPAPGSGPVFPVCQLPPALAGFVGREESIERACALVAPRETAVPLLIVSGPPGVGKSALVTRVAHRLRESFPDGQLFAHLAGSAAPRDTAGVLADLLRSLGVPASAVPQELPALTNAYRAALADRRVLVVLDDAADPAQVRDLLPGTPGSAVLVTGRSRLSGLTDAAHLQLGPLSDTEARQLLMQVAGPDRVADEPGAAGRIAAACGNLPLALRIAGTRLATRVSSVSTLADRLDDQRRRLTELAASDQQVRASLALSVQALSEPARAAFALLHLIGPVDFAGWPVAALLGRPDAEDVLGELVEASLLEPVHPDRGEIRYRLHDLLRVYSAELGGEAVPSGPAPAGAVTPASAPDGAVTPISAPGSAEAPAEAVRRLMVATVFLAGTAASRLPRTLPWARRTGTVPAVPLPAAVVERARTAAADWLGEERSYLVAVAAAGQAAGADREALLLAERIAPYLWVNGYWADLRTVQRLARRAAEATGDAPAGARMEHIAGVLHLVGGDPLAADAAFAASRATFERLGDRHGLACVLADQAVVRGTYRQGAEESVRLAERALELFEAEGDQLAAILTAPALSAALRRLGRFAAALEIDESATVRACRIDAAPIVVARCLTALALTRLLRDRLAGAYSAARGATELLRAAGERYVLVAALHHLALAATGLGRRAEAVRLLAEGHGLAVQLGDRFRAARLERDLAAARVGDGDAAAAVPVLRRCLRIFEETGYRPAQAETWGVLARAHEALGEPAEATAARRRAALLADPHDRRTPILTAIVLRLTEPAGARDAGPGRAGPRVLAGAATWTGRNVVPQG